MVCGLGCLDPGGGRLDEVMRQPCNNLGENLENQQNQLSNISVSRVRAPYRTYWFRAGTDSIFKSAPVSSEVEKTSR